MVDITLTIQSADGARQVSFAKDRVTIGRGIAADIQVDDFGLSDLHASLHRQDERVWILDENSTGGSRVNGRLVPVCGTPLADGDEINIGNDTMIFVAIHHSHSLETFDQPGIALIKPSLPLIAGLILTLIVGITLAAVGSRLFKRTDTRDNHRTKPSIENDNARADANRADDGGETKGAIDRKDNLNGPPRDAAPEVKDTAPRKFYLRMTDDEQNEFIYNQARNVSRMMSNREYVFTDDVLPYIKKYVDGYARRVGNRSAAMWGEDLHALFSRARALAPDIIREFNARGVPKVVGLYIPMIESEYRPCLTSPVGAKGLFQFMPATARGYGVDPDDRCDVKKMAPAAAKYIKDRIAEFGSDAMSVALGIAGYNRSPDSVRRDLSDVINGQNKERSFWTLVANSDKLDRFFQNENIKYVPKFFAAAIVGENPWAFGLEMNPLSTYAGSAVAGEPSREL